MSKWEAVIGIEIHVQLATRTKMFCGCELSFGDPPNTHTCPVCLAHPGALPVPNAEAIRLGILTGLALGCEIATESTFHRKNYFYPDLPKAYQISQYDEPLCVGGQFTYLQEEGEKTIRITRVHLEEDAAKLLHLSGSGRRAGAEQSVVDFNRGGTPLAEIVTEPDLRSGQEASDFLKQLRQTLRELGVSDCNMEEGSMRADANVSVRPAGACELGTKTELKNINSFTFLRRGIEAEIARQIDLIEAGEHVIQETLHFDPATGELQVLRSKEEAHDYRYFPEPDLVPLAPTEEMLSEARAALPELPGEREQRYSTELGLPDAHARQLARDPELGELFEAVVAAGSASPGAAANWVTGEARAREVEPASLASLVAMVEEGKVTNQAARQVLAKLAEGGGDPAEIIESEGLGAMEDSGELEEIVDRALAAHPDEAQKVKDGAMQAIGPIIGFVMRETKGAADGKEVTRIVREKLGL